MALVRSAHGGNVAGVARGGEPVVNGSTDAPALDWWFAMTMMAGNQQDHPVSPRDRLLETAIDGRPGCIESHSVKIDQAVGHDGSAAQSLVPAAIERPLAKWNAPGGSDCRWPNHRRGRLRLGKFIRLFSGFAC